MRFPKSPKMTVEVREPEVREAAADQLPLGYWSTTISRTAGFRLSNGRVIGLDKIESVLPIVDPETKESLGCRIEMVSGKTYDVNNPADEVLDAWLGRKTKEPTP